MNTNPNNPTSLLNTIPTQLNTTYTNQPHHLTTITKTPLNKIPWSGEEIITTNFLEADIINETTGATVHVLHATKNIQNTLTELQHQAHNRLTALLVDSTTDPKCITAAKKIGMRIIDARTKQNPQNPLPLTTLQNTHGTNAVYNLLKPPPAPTKNTKLNQRWLTPMTFGDGITCLISPQGTGKTQIIAGMIKEDDHSIIAPSHLVSLVDFLSGKFNLRRYDDPNSWISLDDTNTSEASLKHITLTPNRRLATTIHSLHKLMINQKIEPYHTIIIDECEQVFRSLVGNMKRKDTTIEVLRFILTNAKRIILMDANLGTLTLSILKKWMPDKKPVVITNEPEDLPERKFEVLEDINEPYVRAINALKAGERIYVYSNSKKIADQFDAYLERHLPSVRRLLITADSSRSENVREFFSDTVNHDYDVIIASPAVSTGVSIDDPRIKRVIGFVVNGVNTGIDVIQAVNRPRHVRSVELYVSPRIEHRPTTEAGITAKWVEGSARERYLAGVKDTGEIGFKSDDYEFIYVTVKKFENVHLNSIKGSVIHAAKSAGYSVEVTKKDAGGALLVKEGRAALSEKVARDLVATPLVSLDEYRSLARSWSRSLEESAQVRKFVEAHQRGLLTLGGVDGDKSDELLVDWVVSGPRLEYVDNLLDSFLPVDVAWRRLDEQKFVLRPDVDRFVIKRELFLRARLAIGLSDEAFGVFLSSGELPDLGRYSVSSQGFIDFVGFVRENYDVLISVLPLPRLGLLDSRPIRFLGSVLRLAGLRQERVGRNANGFYTLERISLMRCLTMLVSRLGVKEPEFVGIVSERCLVKLFGVGVGFVELAGSGSELMVV
jgi:hypothetical protein